MAIKKGKGLLFGVAALTVTAIDGAQIILESGQSAAFQSAGLRKTASFAELPNESGDTTGGAFYNQNDEVTLNAVVFSLTTEADAQNNLAAVLATLVGAGVSIVDERGAVMDGNYIIMDISSPRQNTAFQTVEITIRKYAIDISATTA